MRTAAGCCTEQIELVPTGLPEQLSGVFRGLVGITETSVKSSGSDLHLTLGRTVSAGIDAPREVGVLGPLCLHFLPPSPPAPLQQAGSLQSWGPRDRCQYRGKKEVFGGLIFGVQALFRFPRPGLWDRIEPPCLSPVLLGCACDVTARIRDPSRAVPTPTRGRGPSCAATALAPACPAAT